MKWGLFFIAIGGLGICMSYSPDGTSFGIFFAGIATVIVGFVVMWISAKLNKRKIAEEALEKEHREFEEKQREKRREAGKQRELANVEKSRKNSDKTETTTEE